MRYIVDRRANYCLDTILHVHTIMQTLTARWSSSALNADKNDEANSQMPRGLRIKLKSLLTLVAEYLEQVGAQT